MAPRLLPVLALAISACATLQPVPVPLVVTPVALVEPVEVDAGAVDAGAPVVLAELDAGAPLVERAVTQPAQVEDSEEAPSDFEPPEVVVAATDGGYHYTSDLSDEELARRWEKDPTALGSISIGFVEEGRMINALPFPEGEAWSVIVPESCWTTQETADAIIGAARQVRAWFPEGAPVRVGQVSGPEGGYLPPHVSHQNGRDVDVGLFYPGPEPYRIKERENVMDVPMNWAFVKAILMNGDVQLILLDKRVQKVLYDYALAHGENKPWVESLFHGPHAVFMHARRHRDHFHVRLYNPRAQELAHRLAPLMPKRPEENVAFYRVAKGDTLGGIAHKMGSSVKALKTANHLTDSFLKLRQVLKVPLRGPCTNCPVPPLVVIPPRRVPPPAASSSTAAARSPQG